MSPLGAAALLLALGQSPASSEQTNPCSQSVVQLDALLACAREKSPTLRSAELEVRALEGRREAADVFFPSRPTLELRAAQRELLGSPDVTAFNGGLTLTQEFEIGGQRGRRTAVVDAELVSARQRRNVLLRELERVTTEGFVRLLGAQEEERLATLIRTAGQTLARSARERARRELASELDTTVAESEAAGLTEIAVTAIRRREEASIELGVLLGLDDPSALRVRGNLVEPASVPGSLQELVDGALRSRGELLAAQSDRSALQSQLELTERSRVPNLTVAGFADRDGFGERVLGGSLGIALPLPGLWPNRSGEIAEARARVAQGEARAEIVAREIRREVSNALAEVVLREEAVRAYPPDFRERALRALRTLEAALGDGRLGVRDVLLSQRSLVQALQAEIGARTRLALARIELRRVAGLPLVGEAP